MGKYSRIDINHSAVEELLKSASMPTLQGMGESIAAAAGEGHEVEAFVGHNRARVTVRTATYAARRAEAKNRSLTRAINAGRR